MNSYKDSDGVSAVSSDGSIIIRAPEGQRVVIYDGQGPSPGEPEPIVVPVNLVLGAADGANDGQTASGKDAEEDDGLVNESSVDVVHVHGASSPWKGLAEAKLEPGDDVIVRGTRWKDGDQ